MSTPSARNQPAEPSVGKGHQMGIWYRLYNGETSFDFVGRSWRWFLLSGVVILAGLVSLFTRGLNLGIDFKGGAAWELRAPGVSVTQARDAVRPLGLGEAKIQLLGGDTLRLQSDLPAGAAGDAKRTQVTERLKTLTGGQQVSVSNVGPSWGKDVTNKALRALVFFFLLIAAYISFRFEWKMAVAALAAVVHDIFVTLGVYSLSGFEVTPATVVAFLTILGYSLYDTIVVFDKIEENTRGLAASGRLTYSDTVNLSMNQVLMRSLNTSFVAILPILSVLVIGAYGMGATALQDFGLALLVGLLTGAYSSIFIASPLLAWLKEREPRYASIRQRLEGKAVSGPLTPAAAAGLAAADSGAGQPLRPAARAGAARSASASGRGQVGSRSVATMAGSDEVDGGGTAGSRPDAKRPAPRPRKKGKRR